MATLSASTTRVDYSARILPNALLQPPLLALVYLCAGLAETASVHGTPAVALAATMAACLFACLCFVVVLAADLDATAQEHDARVRRSASRLHAPD